MIYEITVGVGTILFLVLLWGILMSPMNEITTAFINETGGTFLNESVNTTATTQNYNLANTAFYFSLFFVSFVIFIWIVKKAVEYQKEGRF